MMNHDTLANHYRTNFNLKIDHGFSLLEIENMMPWERSIYIDMINAKIKNSQVK